MEHFDWRRIEAALRQGIRQKGEKTNHVSAVIDQLKSLTQKFSNAHWSRASCTKVGKVLLTNNPVVIAPCCPDYAHENGRYTYKGLGGGISLLAARHIDFLCQIQQVVPDVAVLLLMADHEADDPVLCRAARKTREEFLELVQTSIVAIQEHINSFGWRIQAMTEIIPDLVVQEEKIAQRLGSTPEFRYRLTDETFSRLEMYDRIASAAGIRFNEKDLFARTIKTAAQYVAMGNFAAAKARIIVNHTTTNLNWYRQTEAAVIHNPVSVY